MAAYLEFHALERAPFSEPSSGSRVVLGTKALREAFATIRSGLDENVARICVSGRAGLGKTSLARALPKLLGEAARVAVVTDPSVDWSSLREPIARQWGLAGRGLARATLLEASRERPLVLVLDQAERAHQDILDHLDVLLCYRDTDERPVVQSVLFANLDARDQRDPPPLIWWLDRIHTLALEFAPLPRDGMAAYIEKHLKRAGRRGGTIFTLDAAHAIHELSGGIPGEVGPLCERLLEKAALLDRREIDAAFVHACCDGGEAAAKEYEVRSVRQGIVPSRTKSAAFEDELLASPATTVASWTTPFAGWGRTRRSVLAVVTVLIVAVLGIAWMRSGSEPGSSSSRSPSMVGSRRNSPSPSTAPRSTAVREDVRTDGRAPVLARLRGPVLVEDPVLDLESRE